MKLFQMNGILVTEPNGMQKQWKKKKEKKKKKYYVCSNCWAYSRVIHAIFCGANCFAKFKACSHCMTSVCISMAISGLADFK